VGGGFFFFLSWVIFVGWWVVLFLLVLLGFCGLALVVSVSTACVPRGALCFH
jgi:hypothetical protein